MLIYHDVKYTADAQDKIELHKNTKPLTSNQDAPYIGHSKHSFALSGISNYINLNDCYSITDFFLKMGLN